jgi:hypothetical protein
MEFDRAGQNKFDLGRAAHPDSAWDAQSVDARREMQDEFLDAYNYASLLDDEVLRVRIQLWCRDMWQELEDMGA